MKRVVINCTENDKKSILMAFEWSCPFSPPAEQCGENAECSECVKDNIDFQIKD